MTDRADALVIGGGPAGAAAGIRLAARGLKVVLLERAARPQPKVCGEFISESAVLELHDLGVGLPGLGAVPVESARLHAERTEVGFPLPFIAQGLSRERLDAHLLQAAGRAGVNVRPGATVRRLEQVGPHWRAGLADGSGILSPIVVLASGKHELRGHPRPAGRAPVMIGFKMHFRLAPAEHAGLGGAVELFWGGGGYAGLQGIEDTRANLCLVVPPRCFRACGRSWPELLRHLRTLTPALDRRLRDARALWPRPVTIARIPYGYVHPPRAAAPGLYPVGDQMAVIPSFAGEGIAIALRTGRLAADHIISEQPADAYLSAAREQVLRPIRSARLLQSLCRYRPVLGLGMRLAGRRRMLPWMVRATRLRSQVTG